MIAWATVPTILFTVGITIRRVTRTLLGGLLLLGFLEFLLEFLEFLGQISHLARVTTALFPGLLRGIEGLSQPVLLAAVLVEPTTLRGVVGRERSVNSLAPFAILVGTALLGGPLLGPLPLLRFPFLGT